MDDFDHLEDLNEIQSQIINLKTQTMRKIHDS